MLDVDKKTLDIINERYGFVEVLDKLLCYIQVTNRELVEIKKFIKEGTGQSPSPLTEEQLKIMRDSGDVLNGIRKIIDNGRKVKRDGRI